MSAARAVAIILTAACTVAPAFAALDSAAPPGLADVEQFPIVPRAAPPGQPIVAPPAAARRNLAIRSGPCRCARSRRHASARSFRRAGDRRRRLSSPSPPSPRRRRRPVRSSPSVRRSRLSGRSSEKAKESRFSTIRRRGRRCACASARPTMRDGSSSPSMRAPLCSRRGRNPLRWRCRSPAKRLRASRHQGQPGMPSPIFR